MVFFIKEVLGTVFFNLKLCPMSVVGSLKIEIAMEQFIFQNLLFNV